MPDFKEHEMDIPEPVFFRDSNSGEYGMRCVCGEPHRDVELIIQCQMCEYWLHAVCVNVGRDMKNDPFFCPFCLRKRIKCRCGKSMKYDEPLIQCTKCKLWSHKSCEGLEYGRNPKNFVCYACDHSDKVFDLPCASFDNLIPDSITFTDIDKEDLLKSVPEGELKRMIIDDLDKSQLGFRETVTRYFRMFAGVLFDRVHEFWRTFVDSLCHLLKCEKSFLLTAIDYLATMIVYARPITKVVETAESGRSESIKDYLESQSVQRLEKVPESARLIWKSGQPGIRTSVALDDGEFICELNGFLEHTDEVKCEDGIPKSCMLVTDLDLVVDIEGTPVSYLKDIRRSFHFNCIVKLVRINGETKAALYATRMKGPLSEEKSRRGQAILEGGELFLPFDGEIPFPIRKVEWKEKKQRGRPPPAPKPKPTVKPKKVKKPPVLLDVSPRESNITLLSGFLSDDISALPFVILPDKESVDLYHAQKYQKSRVRRPKLDEQL